jgi:hypothetical protein
VVRWLPSQDRLDTLVQCTGKMTMAESLMKLSISLPPSSMHGS